MKPFNLEEARKGKPICIRDGRSAEFIAYVPNGKEDSQVVVLIGEYVMLYFADGRYYNDQAVGCERSEDLMMLPQKRTVWVNFYESSSEYFESENIANNYAHADRIGKKTYPVEIDV